MAGRIVRRDLVHASIFIQNCDPRWRWQGNASVYNRDLNGSLRLIVIDRPSEQNYFSNTDIVACTCSRRNCKCVLARIKKIAWQRKIDRQILFVSDQLPRLPVIDTELPGLLYILLPDSDRLPACRIGDIEGDNQ